MTVHYHGVPITPRARLAGLAGFNFCVGYVRPAQVGECHAIGQAVMLDNGAFTFWRRGVRTNRSWWRSYYDWCEKWLDHRTTWAVIPDVIDGDEQDNDELIRDWPFGIRGSPVWHLHESLRRLQQLAFEWPRVCLGSSGKYGDPGSPAWSKRMARAMDVLCGRGQPPPVDLHMLRGMRLTSGPFPFTSVDSSSVARNVSRGYDPAYVARRHDKQQSPPTWEGLG